MFDSYWCKLIADVPEKRFQGFFKRILKRSSFFSLIHDVKFTYKISNIREKQELSSFLEYLTNSSFLFRHQWNISRSKKIFPLEDNRKVPLHFSFIDDNLPNHSFIFFYLGNIIGVERFTNTWKIFVFWRLSENDSDFFILSNNGYGNSGPSGSDFRINIYT